jgi:hypothetical protein
VQGSAGAKKLRKAYFFPAANAFGVAHPKTDFVAVEPATFVCIGRDLAVDAGPELELKEGHGSTYLSRCIQVTIQPAPYCHQPLFEADFLFEPLPPRQHS